MSQKRVVVEFGIDDAWLSAPNIVALHMRSVTKELLRSCREHGRALVWPSVVVRNRELLPGVPVPGEFRLEAVTVPL